MNISIKGTHVELSDALRNYTEKKLAPLAKFVDDTSHAQIELAKTTNHHKRGEVYRAECTLNARGESYRSSVETVDLYAAIDLMQDELYRAMTSRKTKKASLFKRGAARIKRMLRGNS